MTNSAPDQPLLSARFNTLVPYQSQHADNGIPREVMEYLTANKVFPVISPLGLVGRNAMARLHSWPGFCLTIAQCTPQQGPVAHNHTGTLETFFCLDGKFDLLWGNHLEHSLVLEPGDLCSVPPGSYRAFRNLTDKEARLLVLIQGDQNMSDKIEMPRCIGGELQQKYGDKLIEMLAAINMRFQGEDVPDFSMEQMKQRLWKYADAAANVAGDATFSIMAPKSTGQAAAVECWPGLEVSLTNRKSGTPLISTVKPDRRDWLMNVGETPCEVSWDDQRITLERFDLVCMESGTTFTTHGVSGKPFDLLVASQGKETITH